MILLNKLPQEKKYIAFLLTILSPGLGQCYNGELKKGLIGYIFISTITILIAFSGILDTFTGLLILYSAFLLCYIVIIIDAIIKAKNTQKERLPISKIYSLLTFTGVILFVINIYITRENMRFNTYKLTTTSMSPTLDPGDCVVADQNYYKENKPQTGDILIFNFNGDEYTNKAVFVFSCFGTPGDSVILKNGDTYINSKQITISPELKFTYSVKSSMPLTARFFKKMHITDFKKIDENITELMITKKMANEIRSYGSTISVEIVLKAKEEMDEMIHGSTSFKWNVDNFGPLYVPKKGDIISLDETNIELYKDIILENEKDITMTEGLFYRESKLVSNYTFQQDYYFVLGNNRHNAYDSRYWGFVAKDDILGKANYIYWSKEKDKISKFL